MNIQKKKGVVKNYNTVKKFGFITADDSTTYFFHVSNLLHPFAIVPGETEVLFIPSTNDKGLTAIGIEESKVEITGQFSHIQLPNMSQDMTNAERVTYLKTQKTDITSMLESLKECGIVATFRNDWISLDSSIMASLSEPDYTDGHLANEVTSGYRNTAKHLLELLQKHLNDFNRDYVGTSKGMQGEQKTMYALKSVTLDYPVLNNVRFELSDKNVRYSAESDVIVITDRAVFVIETKNYGGKGDSIEVSFDGRWSLCDGYTHKTKTLNNPFKQSTDHIFAIRKFFKTHGVELNLPIVPIIAIANDDVSIRAAGENASSIMRADMLGTYILNYINSHPIQLQSHELEKIKNVISSANLPPKKYPVIDYHKNLKTICNSISELFVYWLEDETEAQKIKEQKEKKRKAAQAAKEREAKKAREAAEQKAKIAREAAEQKAKIEADFKNAIFGIAHIIDILGHL